MTEEETKAAHELVYETSVPNPEYHTHLLLAVLIGRLERMEMTLVHEVLPLMRRAQGL